jgi:hypothetical protein
VLDVKSRNFAPIQKTRANSAQTCNGENGAIWLSAHAMVFITSPTFQLTKPWTQRRAAVTTDCMSFFMTVYPFRAVRHGGCSE